jgi:Mrp family chromosome partitioning ATPase/capsular polysaccharide biosynthesis protein
VEQRGYWSLLRRYAALVAVLAVIGGGVGAFMELRNASAYVATVRVFATNKPSDNIVVSQSATLAVQRMESYVRLADSSRLADRLISRLGLGMTPAELASRMSASLEKATVIMTVTVGADTADQAQAIAEAVPSEYTSLVNQLADVPISSQDATIFTTIDGPDVSKSSSPTRLALSILFGVVLGGALGMAVASVRARRMAGRTPESLGELTDLPIVGIVPDVPVQAPGDHRAGAVMQSRSLSYQRLAVNLRLLGTQQHRLVVVTAAGRGMGSSSVSVGLGQALAQRGQSVLLIDAAPHDSRVADSLGVTATATLRDVLGGSVALADAVVTVPGQGELAVLPFGSVHDASTGPDERRAVAGLLTSLRESYDTVVLDATPVIDVNGLPEGLDHADAVLLVVDQFGAAQEDTVAAADSLRAMGVEHLALVINRVAAKTVPRRQLLSGVVLPPRAEQPDELSDRG